MVNNLLKQLAASLQTTSYDNQLAANLLTTCNKRVVNKLSQAMRTHPDIDLLTSWVGDSVVFMHQNDTKLPCRVGLPE